MVDPIAPTRDTLSAFYKGDMRMVQAIERLFQVSGQLTPERVEVLSAAIEALAVGGALRPTPVGPDDVLQRFHPTSEAADVLQRFHPANEAADVLPVRRGVVDDADRVSIPQRHVGLSEEITVAVGQVLTIENGLIVEVT